MLNQYKNVLHESGMLKRGFEPMLLKIDKISLQKYFNLSKKIKTFHFLVEFIPKGFVKPYIIVQISIMCKSFKRKIR